MNSARSNVKLKGQMNSKFEFAIQRKADEKRNTMKSKSSNLEI